MIYRILADITMVFHFIWILFLLSGVIFALKKPRIVFLHMGGLLFVLLLNCMGWYCPLTYLENYLHTFHNPGLTYKGSFIINYMERLIYPDLSEQYIRIGGMVFAFVYFAIYAYLLKRYLKT